MPDPIPLRPASPEDLDASTSLLVEVGLVDDGLTEQFGDAYTVGIDDGRIVALAGVECYGAFGLLRSVAVSPGIRGKGLGHALVRDRIRWSRSRGLRALYLLTESAADFFETLGFRRIDRSLTPDEIRRSTEFAHACPESAVAMVLDLETE